MNYKKIYNNLVNSRKQLKRTKKRGDGKYYERHHILPRSLGGSDEKENLVLLTPKEHFIAHLLLTKIHPNESKLAFSFWAMCNQKSYGRDYKVSSKLYNEAKLKFAEFNSKLHKGKTISKQQREHNSQRLKNGYNVLRQKGEKHPSYGKPRSSKVKLKISETKKNNPKLNANYKGYYVTPYGLFYTQKICINGRNFSHNSIKTFFNNPDKIITNREIKNYPEILNDTFLNKTFKEIGFYFVKENRHERNKY